MAAESVLWGQILSTGEDRTCERSISARLPFGILKTLRTSWRARGDGDAGVSYEINATEYEPYGIVAKLRKTEKHSLKAIVSKNVPAAEGYGAKKTIYLAKLAAGELIESSGGIHDLDKLPDDAPEPNLWTPPTITLSPEEAEQGMQLALAEARFFD